MAEFENKEQYTALKSLTEEFTNNLKANYQKGDAYEAYEGGVSIGEALPLIFYKAAHATAETLPTTSNYKAKRLVIFCEKSLPFLTKTFGDDAVQAAFPEAMREEGFIQKIEKLGGKNIATMLKNEI